MERTCHAGDKFGSRLRDTDARALTVRRRLWVDGGMALGTKARQWFDRAVRVVAVAAVAVACVAVVVTWVGTRPEVPVVELVPLPTANPDRTMVFDAQGLSIDLVDPAGVTVEPWSSGNPVLARTEFSVVDGSVVVPRVPSGNGLEPLAASDPDWLLVQDPGDPDGVSSLVSVHRDLDGILDPLQFRVWQDKVEFVWVSDVERRWTASWLGGVDVPLAEMSFTHHERAEESRTYMFEGVLIDDDPPADTAGSSTLGVGVPGTADLRVPVEGGLPVALDGG